MRVRQRFDAASTAQVRLHLIPPGSSPVLDDIRGHRHAVTRSGAVCTARIAHFLGSTRVARVVECPNQSVTRIFRCSKIKNRTPTAGSRGPSPSTKSGGWAQRCRPMSLSVYSAALAPAAKDEGRRESLRASTSAASNRQRPPTRSARRQPRRRRSRTAFGEIRSTAAASALLSVPHPALCAESACSNGFLAFEAPELANFHEIGRESPSLASARRRLIRSTSRLEGRLSGVSSPWASRRPASSCSCASIAPRISIATTPDRTTPLTAAITVDRYQRLCPIDLVPPPDGKADLKRAVICGCANQNPNPTPRIRDSSGGSWSSRRSPG